MISWKGRDGQLIILRPSCFGSATNDKDTKNLQIFCANAYMMFNEQSIWGSYERGLRVLDAILALLPPVKQLED